MFQTYDRASDLPAEWQRLTRDNPWLHPDPLTLLEKLQPCRQQYHFHQEMGIAFVAYSLGLNALALAGGWQVRVPAHIVGLPLSLAEKGYHASSTKARRLMARYLQSQRGLWLILNAVDDFPLPAGNTLPTCQLEIRWTSFDGYLAALRSPYRRWILKGMEQGKDLQVRPLSPDAFTRHHYRLYEAVHARSPYKLEKLSLRFFQQFPSSLYEFCLKGTPVGFVQLAPNPPVLTFLFCGLDHRLVSSHQLYLNMLLWILKQSIEDKCQVLDFGQTTEETKTKLGAVIMEKKLYLSHSHPALALLMPPIARWLSYPGYPITHHVFKESGL